MHNLSRYYNQNKRKIWTTIAFIIIAYIIIRLMLGNLNMSENTNGATNNGNSSMNNTTISSKETNPVGSTEGISNTEAKKNKDVIGSFIDYCNNKDVQSAYDLLTDECKETNFPTIKEFTNNYYTKIFTKYRLYDMQTWFKEDNYATYSVVITEDILSTGQIQSTDSFSDYYTVVKTKDGDLKLNINSYIGRKEIGKETKTSNITINVISKDMYMDYEIYNIEVKNENENTILLDTKTNTKSVYLSDTNDLQYSAYMYEIDDIFLKLEKGISRRISIKFNKVYNPDRVIRGINFTDIVLDYEDYLKNKSEEYTKKTIMVEV